MHETSIRRSPRPGPVWIDAIPGLVFVVAITLVLLRRPEIITRPQFVWEEGFWYAITFVTHPIATLIEPWAGFTYLLPRAAFLAARLVPPEAAPSMTSAVHLFVVGGVAASLASARLTSIASPVARFVLGCSVALLPGASGPFLSVLNVGWILSIPLAMVAVTPEPGSRLGKAVECALILIAALTGPASIVLLPLFLFAARSPYRQARAGIVLAGAVLQWFALTTSTRRPVVGLEPLDVPTVLLERLASALLGDFASASWFDPVPGSLLVIGIAIVCVVSLLLRRTRPPMVLALLYLGAVFGTLGVLATGPELDTPGHGSRYFLVSAVGLVAIAVAGLEHGQRLGIVILGLFVIGAVVDFQMPSYPDTEWPAHARCIGGASACVVPMEPLAWSVHWPGSASRLVIPSGHDEAGWPRYE